MTPRAVRAVGQVRGHSANAATPWSMARGPRCCPVCAAATRPAQETRRDAQPRKAGKGKPTSTLLGAQLSPPSGRDRHNSGRGDGMGGG